MKTAWILPRTARLAGATFLLAAGLAPGQHVEVTPLVGARLFGTVKLDPAGSPRFDGHMAGSITYGVAAGYRYESGSSEDHDLIEFRWMRQDSHLYIRQNAMQVPPYTSSAFTPSVTLDHFLADFTHEFTVPDAKMIQLFLTLGVGASHLSSPASGTTRFAFDAGGGVKVFPRPHWGFRFTVEYMPTVMFSDVQRLVCAAGCVVVLNGGVMSQLNLSIGPAFRF